MFCIYLIFMMKGVPKVPYINVKVIFCILEVKTNCSIIFAENMKTSEEGFII